MAMVTRISTGTSVQATSSAVLCVVLVGTGLARSLNLMITITNSTNTNSVIAVMMYITKLWNQLMLSMIDDAEPCNPSCQGLGWPTPASATPPPATAAASTIPIAINRVCIDV